MSSYLFALKEHMQRLYQWEIAKVQPMPSEQSAMASSLPTNADPRVTLYTVWRRSNLLCACPLLIISMVFGILDLQSTYQDRKTVFHGFGLFLASLTSVDGLVLFLFAVAASYCWTAARRCTLLIRTGWVLSFILPIIPALFPLEMMLQPDIEERLPDSILFNFKVRLALTYLLELVPLVITFPGGAVSGSLIVRVLLPESTLAGWMLMLVAPFYSLMILILLVVMIQVTGDPFLLVGTALLVASPWLYVYYGSAFTGATQGTHVTVARVHRAAGAVATVGFILLLVWSLTAESNGIRILGSESDDDEPVTTTGNGVRGGRFLARVGPYALGGRDGDATGPDHDDDDDDDYYYLVTYKQVVRLIFETMGRSIVTMILFTDLILGMTLRNWMVDRQRREVTEESDLNSPFVQFLQTFNGTTGPKAFHQLTKDVPAVSPKARAVAVASPETSSDDSLPEQPKEVNKPKKKSKKSKKKKKDEASTQTEIPANVV